MTDGFGTDPDVSLTDRQRRGLRRTGDAVVPGDDALPAFSASGVPDELGRMLRRMDAEDRRDVRMLLDVFAYLPRPAIGAVLRLSEAGYGRGRLGRPLRMLNVGVKGVVAGSYYSDPGDDGIHGALGWDAGTATPPDEAPAERRRSLEARERNEANLAEAASDDAEAAPPVVADASPSEAMERTRGGAVALRDSSLDERLDAIARLREVVVEERDRIVDRVCAATGKSRGDALVSDVFGTLDHLHYLERAAPDALATKQAHTPLTMLGKDNRVRYDPLGVVLVIAPWNYPFYQAIVPTTSAFAAGNAVVFKPSEHTPMEGLVEHLLDRAGWDDDWVNVVYGDGEVGAALVDEAPDKIHFTGSTSAGSAVMRQASEHLVPVELELGGKDPMLVFPDAGIERAAAGAVWGGLTNAGQSCTSIEKCYVHEDVYGDFREALLDRVATLRHRAGDAGGEPDDADRGAEAAGTAGWAGSCDVGSMTADFQVETVWEHVRDAEERGATRLTGADWQGEGPDLPPMVLEEVPEDALVATDETFGPVLPLFPFADEDEAVRRANDTPYGLSASVWTADGDRAERVTERLEVGNVSVNDVMATEANPALPFGGVKDSGFGRYKGEDGLRSFTNVKAVAAEGHDEAAEVHWYPYTEEKLARFERLIEARFAGKPLSLLRTAVRGLHLDRIAGRRRDD